MFLSYKRVIVHDITVMEHLHNNIKNVMRCINKQLRKSYEKEYKSILYIHVVYLKIISK